MSETLGDWLFWTSATIVAVAALGMIGEVIYSQVCKRKTDEQDQNEA